MSTYLITKNEIIKRGCDVEPLEALASALMNLENIDHALALIAQLDVLAEALPWLQDRDFGALALQKFANMAVNKHIARLMIIKAIERARWCATCCTSGGEGLARAVHLHELEQELQRHG